MAATVTEATMKRSFLAPVFALATLAVTAGAHAQYAPSSGANAQSPGWIDNNRAAAYARDRRSYYDSRRVAYDNGFREGVRQGEKDGRKRDRFAYQDEKTFQRADKGYHREFGDVERYRQSFRGGYAAGYTEGYQRVAPRGRYGDYGDWRDDRRGPYDQRGGTYRGGSYRYPGQVEIAVQRGLDDGYEKGIEDARRNRSFDPLRHAWYRAGDRRYEGRFGSREQYKDLYRQGFQEGYERGYRYR